MVASAWAEVVDPALAWSDPRLLRPDLHRWCSPVEQAPMGGGEPRCGTAWPTLEEHARGRLRRSWRRCGWSAARRAATQRRWGMATVAPRPARGGRTTWRPHAGTMSLHGSAARPLVWLVVVVRREQLVMVGALLANIGTRLCLALGRLLRVAVEGGRERAGHASVRAVPCSHVLLRLTKAASSSVWWLLVGDAGSVYGD